MPRSPELSMNEKMLQLISVISSSTWRMAGQHGAAFNRMKQSVCSLMGDNVLTQLYDKCSGDTIRPGFMITII